MQQARKRVCVQQARSSDEGRIAAGGDGAVRHGEEAQGVAVGELGSYAAGRGDFGAGSRRARALRGASLL